MSAVSDSLGNNPDIDPANNDNLAGVLQFTFMKMLQGVNTRLPAQVIKYDRTTNRVQVQILIAMMTTDGSIVSRSQIDSLPVKRYGGGGYVMSFPLNPGDLGWIEANDRDISLFLQSYTESPPNTARLFNFSDSVFFPDVMTGYNVQTIDADNFVLSNIDGTVRISLTPAGVVITSPVVAIDGALAANGGFTSVGGSGATQITLTGLFQLTGNMHVSGDITASGAITPGVPP
jgi:hypothetical protein